MGLFVGSEPIEDIATANIAHISHRIMSHVDTVTRQIVGLQMPPYIVERVVRKLLCHHLEKSLDSWRTTWA
jgi:hypothetical protein